ncbi:fibrous sheath-interacting protein 2-like [Arapaima gigas]
MAVSEKSTKLQIPSESSKLFGLPLGRKVHVRPKDHCVLHTTRLCEKLFMQKSDFDLSDPNGFRINSAYNCLHDPNLRRYLYRRDLHRHLIDEGFITEDDQVICSPTEFNRFKDYVAEVRLGWDLKFKMEQKKIVQAFLVQQEQGKITADKSISELIERLLRRGQTYFRNQEDAVTDRDFQRLWKDNESSLLKLPKINSKSSLTSLFEEDEMVWKVKGRMMLEEIVKEVQRELWIERQKKAEQQTKEKQKQELHSKKPTLPAEKRNIVLEAVRKPRDGLAHGRNGALRLMGSAPFERRPSLQRLKPLPKIKTNRTGSSADVVVTSEHIQDVPSHNTSDAGRMDSELFGRRLGFQKLKPLPKIKMVRSRKRKALLHQHRNVFNHIYFHPIATAETLTTICARLSPTSILQSTLDQLETTVENLVDRIMDHQFPYSS